MSSIKLELDTVLLHVVLRRERVARRRREKAVTRCCHAGASPLVHVARGCVAGCDGVKGAIQCFAMHTRMLLM